MRNERPRVIIKKRGGGHGHHGGAWKVAYADFVTAMMALFMVLWLLASTDSKARKEISDYFRSGILPDGELAMSGVQLKPSIMQETATPPTQKGMGDGAGSGMGGDAIRQAEEVEHAIERMAKEDPLLAELSAQVTVSVTDEGVLIEAADKDGEGMLFALASSDLKPALVSFLEKLAPVLQKSGRKLRINGHTDARQFVARAGKNNWDLSYERANSARVVLGKHGISADQIQSVQAFASSQLKDPSRPLAAENRRLSVLMLNPPRPPVPVAPVDPAAAGPDAPTAPPADGHGAAAAPPAEGQGAVPAAAPPVDAHGAPAAAPPAASVTAAAPAAAATPPPAPLFEPIVPPLPPPPAPPASEVVPTPPAAEPKSKKKRSRSAARSRAARAEP